MESTQIIAVLAVGGGLFIGLVAVVMGILHSRRLRLLTHAERMKALELGREIPDDDALARLKAVCSPIQGSADKAEPVSLSALARRCFSVALWVPIASVGLSLMFGREQAAGDFVLWAAVGVIATASIICGSNLALKSATLESAADSAARNGFAHKDGQHDPDAYDVAGRRG
jgi:hypothetical protein